MSENDAGILASQSRIESKGQGKCCTTQINSSS